MYFNSKTTGYIPSTVSVGEYEPMVEFWAENPNYKLAYDQMQLYGHCEELPYDPVGQDFTQIIWDACSRLIDEQSITPEEAIEQIKADAATLW